MGRCIVFELGVEGDHALVEHGRAALIVKDVVGSCCPGLIIRLALENALEDIRGHGRAAVEPIQP
jgi:hypothetical protein